MFERLMHNNEIVSLTIMLMMVMALVASQADATIQDEVREKIRAEAAIEQLGSRGTNITPRNANIEGHFGRKVLTISIDTMGAYARARLQGPDK